MEGLLGSSGEFGQKFPEGGLNFLEVALVGKFPYGNLPKQSSKKFASELPKLLKSPSRSGSMRKLVTELSYKKSNSKCFSLTQMRRVIWRSSTQNRRKLAATTPTSCDIVGLLQESKRPLPRKLQEKMTFLKFFFEFSARFQLFFDFF